MYRIKKRKGSNSKTLMPLFLEHLAFFFLSALWVTILSFRKKYDVIHVHNLPDFQVFAAIIPKTFGSRLILDIHDIVPEFYGQKFGVQRDHILVRFLKWVERISIAYADHVIVANHVWRDTLIKRSVNGTKVTVILNAPDDSYFRRKRNRKTNPENFTLKYHGTLKEHFGVDVAIRAIDILRSKIPNIKLEIVGWGSMKKDLIRLVSELNVERFVYFYEPLPIDKIPEFVGEADVGVVPKRRGIFSDNALSTKLLEFVKMGIPAVVSAAPVEKSYFDGKMVMFFEPDNPADLARAVVELYNDPKKGKELARNADKFNRKHNWKHYREEYYKLIDRLYDQRHSKMVKG